MLPITKDIDIVRGDTFATGVKVYVSAIPDNIYFTCYGNIPGNTIFSKQLGEDISIIESQTSVDKPYTSFKIRIAPEDTRDISPGKYLYEIKLSFEGDIRTIVQGTLTIIPEVVKVE